MKTLALISAAWLVLAAAALAQEMPKPGPDHKKLDIFAGSWTLDGDMKPGSMGPGGKMTENEKCEWMDGDFFLRLPYRLQELHGQRIGHFNHGLFRRREGLHLPRVQ